MLHLGVLSWNACHCCGSNSTWLIFFVRGSWNRNTHCTARPPPHPFTKPSSPPLHHTLLPTPSPHPPPHPFTTPSFPPLHTLLPTPSPHPPPHPFTTPSSPPLHHTLLPTPSHPSPHPFTTPLHYTLLPTPSPQPFTTPSSPPLHHTLLPTPSLHPPPHPFITPSSPPLHHTLLLTPSLHPPPHTLPPHPPPHTHRYICMHIVISGLWRAEWRSSRRRDFPLYPWSSSPDHSTSIVATWPHRL